MDEKNIVSSAEMGQASEPVMPPVPEEIEKLDVHELADLRGAFLGYMHSLANMPIWANYLHARSEKTIRQFLFIPENREALERWHKLDSEASDNMLKISEILKQKSQEIVDGAEQSAAEGAIL